MTAARILEPLDLQPRCGEIVNAMEPYPMWEASWLSFRHRCFVATGDPRAASAREDLRRYQRRQSVPFDAGLAVDDPVGGQA